MIVELSVFCANCDEEIVKQSLHLSDDETPRVDVSEFSQSTWVCPSCGHHTLIGDIDAIDGEEAGYFPPVEEANDNEEDDEK